MGNRRTAHGGTTGREDDAGLSGVSGVSGSGPVQSVDRAVAILEILARDGEAGVTEVARELDVHKSTASRLLAALDRRELVTQDSARGKFRLGVGIVRLAGAASRKLDVVQESRPVCRALAQEVGETVNLAILSGRDRSAPAPSPRGHPTACRRSRRVLFQPAATETAPRRRS